MDVRIPVISRHSVYSSRTDSSGRHYATWCTGESARSELRDWSNSTRSRPFRPITARRNEPRAIHARTTSRCSIYYMKMRFMVMERKGDNADSAMHIAAARRQRTSVMLWLPPEVDVSIFRSQKLGKSCFFVCSIVKF